MTQTLYLHVSDKEQRDLTDYAPMVADIARTNSYFARLMLEKAGAARFDDEELNRVAAMVISESEKLSTYSEGMREVIDRVDCIDQVDSGNEVTILFEREECGAFADAVIEADCLLVAAKTVFNIIRTGLSGGFLDIHANCELATRAFKDAVEHEGEFLQRLNTKLSIGARQ